MTTILLREMSLSEIDWIRSVGKPVELKAGTVLIHSDQTENSFYVICSGEFSLHLTSAEQPESPVCELDCLTAGQVIGVLPFLQEFLPAVTVQALTPATVLAIPGAQLQQKLETDARFAAHFFRASARFVLQRLVNFSQQIGCSVAQLSQMQLREAAVVFAELQDSDMDWLIAVGRVQSLAAETRLVQANRPVDDLHLILDGAASLHLVESSHFLAEQTELGPEFARLSRGDWVGETLMLDAFPTNLTVRIVRETQVLSIPQWRLKAKLWHDPDFAARFYRVLAILLANKQQVVIQQLTHSTHKHELDHQRLTQMTLAEARFEWMLKRIQTQLKSGETVQW